MTRLRIMTGNGILERQQNSRDGFAHERYGTQATGDHQEERGQIDECGDGAVSHAMSESSVG